MTVAVLGEYLVWQYSRGVREFLNAWKNVHRFLFHFFSIPILLKSFIAPFHRIEEKKERGFDVQNVLEVFIINMVTRLVGVFVRSIIIILGLVSQALAFIAGVVLFIAVVGMPVVAPAAVLAGFSLLFF